MILVVFSHIACWCFGNRDMGYNDVFIRFRMPIFFFISGWVFYKVERVWNKENIYNILKNKFRVQFIPFIFFMLLFISLFEGSEYPHSFEDKYGYWFTFSLFEFFVLYIVIEYLFNKQSNNQKDFFVLIVMLILSIMAYYYEIIRYSVDLGAWKLLLTTLSFSKIKYIIFFWLGTFVKKNFTSYIRLTDNQYFIAACLSIFLTLLIIPNTNSNYCIEYITYLLSGISGIVVLFTFFKKHEVIFSKNNRFGSMLQYIGQRTLDIYLLHYFILPYHMKQIGTWLSQYSNKSVDMFIIFFLSLWIISITLLMSNIIRLSPFLAHFLFGAKRE